MGDESNVMATVEPFIGLGSYPRLRAYGMALTGMMLLAADMMVPTTTPSILKPGTKNKETLHAHLCIVI